MIRNEIILASAGTGKTYTLSNRIIRLLALGAAPDSIVALTFTRKAAAEFVAKVLAKLADAADDQTAAGRLAAELDLGPVGREQFGELLAGVVRSIDRLQFGTLDSFFQRIAQSFPFEFGLPGAFEIIEGRAAGEARERVLRGLLRAGGQSGAAMVEAFRLATWGTEEKNLERSIVNFVNGCHELFLRADDAGQWGDAATIWPDGCAWLPAPADIAGDLAALRDGIIAKEGLLYDAVAKFADAAEHWSPGTPLPAGAGTLLARLLETFDALRAGGPVELIYHRRTYEVSGAVATGLARIVHRFVGGSIDACLRIARGICEILARYESAYEREVRAAGQLGFADVTEVLRRDRSLDWQFRLDARLSHWLFDEFQDTSLLQWSVVENLVDEILQDPSGRRSAFFVGDPKQSIYRWRGGEHRLMTELLDRYGAAIECRSLEESHRSTEPVIALVNAFGGQIARSERLLPAPAVAEWARIWKPHTSARPELPGFACVRECEETGVPLEAILEIVREVDPIRRGRTCAILARSNNDVREIARGLRDAGIHEVVSETDEAVAMDNPITRALIAVFAAVAFPSDSASARFAGMTPIGKWIERRGGWPRVRNELLRSITLAGFEAALRAVIDGVREELPADPFAIHRVGQLTGFAREFDRRGSRDLPEFLRTISEQTHREAAGAGWIQVMTIHKAKGLGFGVVILPVGETTRMDSAPDGILLAPEDGHHRPRWVMKRPVAVVAGADTTLGPAYAELRTQAAYESFCTWYVALTRAERASYVLLPKPKKSESGETLSPVRLIRAAVSGGDPAEHDVLWECGNPRWFEDAEPRPIARRACVAPVAWDSFPARPRLERLRPSMADDGAIDARSRLDPSALALGSAVHARFASIEWLREGEAWKPPSGERSAADEIVAGCLTAPGIAALFKKPDGDVTLWRERAFDVVMDARWVTGVFDRVILRAESAILVDFKTDSADPAVAAARHKPQLLLYRQALAVLAGLPEVAIRVVLVHARSRTAIEITG